VESPQAVVAFKWPGMCACAT